jgi:hypothetical protein
MLTDFYFTIIVLTAKNRKNNNIQNNYECSFAEPGITCDKMDYIWIKVSSSKDEVVSLEGSSQGNPEFCDNLMFGYSSFA